MLVANEWVFWTETPLKINQLLVHFVKISNRHLHTGDEILICSQNENFCTSLLFTVNNTAGRYVLLIHLANNEILWASFWNPRAFGLLSWPHTHIWPWHQLDLQSLPILWREGVIVKVSTKDEEVQISQHSSRESKEESRIYDNGKECWRWSRMILMTKIFSVKLLVVASAVVLVVVSLVVS